MTTCLPISSVVMLLPPAAMSGVRWPWLRMVVTAASTAFDSSSRPSEWRNSMADARMVANGFAIPFPAMSGAEPWIGS